jgi:dihydroneopterin aldolase
LQKKKFIANPLKKISLDKRNKNSDSILVRDYLKHIEIGAFQSEYDVKQRVSFNVSLKVKPQDLAFHDNVDCVLSYDNIIEIIEEEIRGERVDLLETLAEKIALSCLSLEGVNEAKIHIEKLDKGAGKLGVEIIRSISQIDSSAWAMWNDGKRNLNIQRRIPNVSVLYVTSSVFKKISSHVFSCLSQNDRTKWVICFSEIFDQFLGFRKNNNDLKIRLMSISQSAMKFQDVFPDWPLASSKTEISFLLKQGTSCLWCPKSNIMDTSKNGHTTGKLFSFNLAVQLTKSLFLNEIYTLSVDKEAQKLRSQFLPEGINVKII